MHDVDDKQVAAVYWRPESPVKAATRPPPREREVGSSRPRSAVASGYHLPVTASSKTPEPGGGSEGPARAAGDHRAPSRRGSWLHNPWLWATLAGLVLIPAMRPFLRFEPAPPPVLFELPTFSLVDQHGQSYGSAELDGKVYVASFLFTRCTSICPAIVAAVQRLEDRYRQEGVDGIELVSFTVDPEHDTPQVLAEYAERRGIESDRWRLLTGTQEQLHSLVVGGFKTAMGPATYEDPAEDPAVAPEAPNRTAQLLDIAHAGRLALVDRRGGVRGYYDLSIEGLDELFHRSQHVLAERRPPRRR